MKADLLTKPQSGSIFKKSRDSLKITNQIAPSKPECDDDAYGVFTAVHTASKSSKLLNTIPACQPDRGLSAGIYIQHSPTLRRPLQTSAECPHRERNSSHASFPHVVVYSQHNRGSNARPPNQIFQSANCATGPITCWNTIPACQPDRGLSAAIYIQQKPRVEQQDRYCSCLTNTNRKRCPGNFGNSHMCKGITVTRSLEHPTQVAQVGELSNK
jgi:hypothetical protein